MKLKKVLACMAAVTMVAALPVSAYAARHDVTSAQDITNVMDGTVADTDDEITFDLRNDIDSSGEKWNTQDGKTYTINGNDYSLTDVIVGGDGTVMINADVKGGVNTTDSADITINGDVGGTSTYTGIYAIGSSKVAVNGNVEDVYVGVSAGDDSKVVVNGDIVTNGVNEMVEAVSAAGSSEVTVNGDISGGYYGIYARENSLVTVGGDVSGIKGVLTIDKAEVTIDGNVTVPEDVSNMYDNYTVSASGESVVTIGGYATGGNGVYKNDSATVTILNHAKDNSDTNDNTPSTGDDSSSDAKEENLKILSDITDTAHTVGSTDAVEIHCNGAVADFVALYIDSQLVDSANYTVADGSTIITLKQSYADSLSVGKHTVTLEYSYGSIDTELVVSGKADTENSASSDTQNKETDTAKADTSAEKTSTTQTSSGTTNATSPKTDDNNVVGAWVVIGVAAGAAIVATSKRKRNA